MASAKACLRFEQRPQTPEKVRKYRSSYFAEPGCRVTHPASIDDRAELCARLENTRLGLQTVGGEGVADVFRTSATDSLNLYIEQRKEAIYKSVQREPLGKPYKRGHVLPPNLTTFGKPSDNSNEVGKELLYPRVDSSGEDERFHSQYVKSHGSYRPGEQRQRSYDWKNIDPASHRFGIVDKAPLVDGVAACLQPEETQLQTTVTSLNVENFKNVSSDRLGRCRNFGRSMGERAAFGQGAEAKEAEWTAEQCIQGEYSVENQAPDKDLGTAIRPGWRNQTKDVRRTFGCPTVRTDIQAPARRSISDNQNYGDDTNASKLLYPSRFSIAGVEDDDFVQARSAEELRTLFEKIGHQFDDHEFYSLLEQAQGLEMTRPGEASVEEFRRCLNERLDEEDMRHK